MKASHKRTFRTLALWPAIVCLCLAAPLLPTTNAKKEARNSATTRFVHGTSLQDEKGPKVDKSDAMEVTEIPCLSKPQSGAPSNPPKSGAVPNGVGSPAFVSEVEPNNTPATAQALGTTPVRVRGDLYQFPIGTGDVDVYSFTANAGDRVYAATMTGFSGGSTDTVIDIIAPDQTTVLETDDEDGAIGASASNIAGTLLASAGTYYVRVRPFSTTLSGTIRPYDLYVRVLSGTPAAETEPNNNGGTPNPLPANGWVSGVIGTAADNDTFSVPANAGDTIVAILDVDPERDSPEWNARLAIGVFNGFFLLVNGSGVGGTFDDANPSEAMFMTVKAAGTYVVYVDEAVSGGAANFTYNLSVSVIPGDTTRICTNYAGTGGAIADLATTDFTLNIPDSKIIDNLQLSLNITHAATADLDVSLISPDGNEVVLFDDPPTGAGAAAPQMDLTLDDEAAIPISLFGVHSGMKYTPESYARLAYFKGMQAQGTWTLRVRDDLTANAGTLNSWSITVCEARPGPGCAGQPTTLLSTDFESGDAGFTHSGTQDEWQRGLPAFAPITTAHSGTNAWKTDLVNTYNASSNQDLLSPNINLISASGPVTLSWWQKYQIESASFDTAFVEVREVGVPTNFRRLWEWKGATQTRGVGSPAVTVQMSAGWGLMQYDISDFIGKNVEVRFHLESDSSVQFAGLAIDDVSVTACAPNVSCTLTCPANITQPNDPNQCGAVVTYPAPAAEGDCGTVDCSPASGSFFPVGTTTVTCTASGGQPGAPSGGVAPSTCTFTVTVEDTQPPSITCPANITTSNTANQCGAVVNYPAPTITDNCPGTFTATCIPPSGSFFPVGTTTVTCSVNGFGGEMKPALVIAVRDAITFKAGSNKPAGIIKGGTPKKEAGKGSSGRTAVVNSPAAVLYSQTGASTNGAPSQNFEASFDAFDCQSADDFVVPAGQIWNVTQVNVGGTFSATGPATSLNVTFYNNSGTLPGPTAVASYANVATFTLAPNFNITLPSAAVLPAGTYWVSVQANMDFGVGGQWFWSNFGATNIGSEYAWRNPGGGFGTPCAGFGAGSTGCNVGGGVNRNNVFDIIGTISMPGGGPSCTFTVTVNDTQPPAITCPPNQTAVTDQNVCPAPACQVVNYPAPVASDNCPGVGVVCNPPAGSCFPTGVTTVTCTATDASGNTATCSFTVTTFDTALEDDSDPSIILLWNSITGQYRFCCNGITFTGVGKATRQGCVYTLDHTNAVDRRILGRVDKAVHAGAGSLQAPPGTIRCTITDRNTLNDPLTPACQ